MFNGNNNQHGKVFSVMVNGNNHGNNCVFNGMLNGDNYGNDCVFNGMLNGNNHGKNCTINNMLNGNDYGVNTTHKQSTKPSSSGSSYVYCGSGSGSGSGSRGNNGGSKFNFVGVDMTNCVVGGNGRVMTTYSDGTKTNVTLTTPTSNNIISRNGRVINNVSQYVENVDGDVVTSQSSSLPEVKEVKESKGKKEKHTTISFDQSSVNIVNGVNFGQIGNNMSVNINTDNDNDTSDSDDDDDDDDSNINDDNDYCNVNVGDVYANNIGNNGVWQSTQVGSNNRMDYCGVEIRQIKNGIIIGDEYYPLTDVIQNIKVQTPRGQTFVVKAKLGFTQIDKQ